MSDVATTVPQPRGAVGHHQYRSLMAPSRSGVTWTVLHDTYRGPDKHPHVLASGFIDVRPDRDLSDCLRLAATAIYGVLLRHSV